MNSKPPTSTPTDAPSSTKLRGKPDPDEADDDADQLKNDYALQRLLRESHLLDGSASFSARGALRHKAMDLRLRDLGAKSSILRQEKMPMAHRKGIAAKAKSKEDRRREEARQNGVVLEKARPAVVRGSRRRDTGIDAPSVGRFKGGTLKLSKGDLSTIKGASTGRFGESARRRK
ncbi:MAG: hypothetical protein M1826_005537 [Phylliscum demangeonii]|nr:MAG: hypothetical protein M1826_005537 [Phylliscum demangeonii]